MNNIQSYDQMIAALITYYSQTMASGDDDPHKLGWENRDAQERRFQVLVEAVPLKSGSILDIGAGMGDLSNYLKQRQIEWHYNGTEILANFAAIARQRTWPSLIHEIDVFHQPTYFAPRSFNVVYASGPFNLSSYADEAFLEHGFGVMCDLSSDFVVVSLLHDCSPEPEAIYRYFDPVTVAKRLARPDFQLKVVEGYLPNDFTLVARRLQ